MADQSRSRQASLIEKGPSAPSKLYCGPRSLFFRALEGIGRVTSEEVNNETKGKDYSLWQMAALSRLWGVRGPTIYHKRKKV